MSLLDLVRRKQQRRECLDTWSSLLCRPQGDRIGELSDEELMSLMKLDCKTIVILNKAIKYAEIQEM